MDKTKQSGFGKLTREAAAIGTLATAIWGLARELALPDILFRCGTVYLGMSILSLLVLGRLARLTAVEGAVGAPTPPVRPTGEVSP